MYCIYFIFKDLSAIGSKGAVLTSTSKSYFPCKFTCCHDIMEVFFNKSTVSDTGTGMSREQAQKLFRLDSAQSRKGTSAEQGTGLGLIICRELLEKHKTTLHVASEEGKGSRFWFEI